MKKIMVTNTIRKYRFNNNEMTQEALAKAVGVTRQTIIALEANRYTPSLALAFRIARVFGATIEDIFQVDCPDPYCSNSQPD